MTRVKRGNVARKSRNKILELNRGYRGSHSTLVRTAKQRTLKALTSSYDGRRKKKRDFRQLWIKRINGAVRTLGSVTYSKIMHKMKKNQVNLNRKMLSQLVILDPAGFEPLMKYE